MVPDKNNYWTPKSFKFSTFSHQIHLYIFTPKSFHRLNPVIEASPITPPSPTLVMWEQTLSLHHSLLKRNSFLLFSFCRFGASILFFCWFGLQKTYEINIINTIISLTSDARARPPLCTFFLFSESSSSPSPHVYFSIPFSLSFFFSQKRMDLKNLRCRKVKKKKEEMLWRRAHVHKEKNNDYFLFINSRDQTKFPCIFHENTVGNHNKSILDPQLQNYRTTLIAKQVIYVSRGWNSNFTMQNAQRNIKLF
jgi:hypothetical protein